jgi:hypothetical protein
MPGASKSAGRSNSSQKPRQEVKIAVWSKYVKRQEKQGNLSQHRESCAQENSFLELTITENQLFPIDVCLS